jgi:hypothetical protein
VGPEAVALGPGTLVVDPTFDLAPRPTVSRALVAYSLLASFGSLRDPLTPSQARGARAVERPTTKETPMPRRALDPHGSCVACPAGDMTCPHDHPLDAFLEELRASGYRSYNDEIDARFARSGLVRCTNSAAAGVSTTGVSREGARCAPSGRVVAVATGSRSERRSDSRADTWLCVPALDPAHRWRPSNLAAGRGDDRKSPTRLSAPANGNRTSGRLAPGAMASSDKARPTAAIPAINR